MATVKMIQGQPNLNPTAPPPPIPDPPGGIVVPIHREGGQLPRTVYPGSGEAPPVPEPDPSMFVSKQRKVTKGKLPEGQTVARPNQPAVLPLHPGMSITHRPTPLTETIFDTPELGADRPTPRASLPIRVGRNPVNHAREIMWEVEETHRITGKPVTMPYKAMEGISIHFSIFHPILSLIGMYKQLESGYDLLLKERDDAVQARKEADLELAKSEKRVLELMGRVKRMEEEGKGKKS